MFSYFVSSNRSKGEVVQSVRSSHLSSQTVAWICTAWQQAEVCTARDAGSSEYIPNVE